MWQIFAREHTFTSQQVDLFKKFYHLLRTYNKAFNLTALEEEAAIIQHHFNDSLALSTFLDMKNTHSLADVGSGGGFPGIPLKIAFPHLKLFLIEVKEKKIDYLKKVVEELSLEDVQVVGLDWRTFLRHTTYEIDVFCARASLKPKELLHMFKPASPYRNSLLVYWASQLWQPEKHEVGYLKEEHFYTIENKKRKLVFFADKKT